MNLYNTYSKKIEELKPLNPKEVAIYTCGPTVYDFTHIGHLKKYVGDDLLRRALEFFGYKVKLVRNVTDVGHLVSDADEGEDKLEKGAKREGKSVWDVAREFEKYFDYSMDQVGVEKPEVVCRATEHIPSQIKLIQELEKKGFTYDTTQAVYFDIAKFKDYGKLSGQSLEDKLHGVRDEVVVDSEKRNPADFALWFKTVGHFKDHMMHWDSPWGDGFPGWHIECSAMSMEYLGSQLDIHTGGVDHIPVHHENEIAQSEAATGKKFVQIWMHHEFLAVDGMKMSKSLQNFYTVDDVKKRGFEPLALRYLFLSAHYRQKLNFTWEALDGAQNSLNNIRKLYLEKKEKTADQLTAGDVKVLEDFKIALNEDLNIPKALAVFWEALKDSNISFETIEKMDKVLGLQLSSFKKIERKVSDEALGLAKKRDELRKEKKFLEADTVRGQIVKLGYQVEDTKEGTLVK